MIDLRLAQELRDAGLTWDPDRGDRFVVPDRDMDDEVFVVSDMAVEVREHSRGPVLGFNGTTEWALDSVERDEVLWLPREDQLRALLGDRFLRLERDGDRWVVATVGTSGEPRDAVDGDVESAYALGLLQLMREGWAA